MVSPEAGEACFASLLDSVPFDMSWPDLGDEKYAIALPGNHMADQSLRVAVAVYFRCVD